jgi:CheY-like chemotaxis protein
LNPIAGLGADLEGGVPTGVGLAVVQSRSRGWGGNMQILPRSEHGGGFRVFLPVFDAATTAEAAGRRAASDEPVLVVDDDPACVQLATEALAAAGYGVVSAATGRDALALLAGESTAPAAAVVDATLPDDMSKEILAALRAEGRDVPVVMVSGFSRDYLHGFLPRGSWHFLQKPFGGEDISSVIDQLLQGHGHSV